jgi:hypothetical protein
MMQMVSVPHDVMNEYVAILKSREIPAAQVEYYKKWLRYHSLRAGADGEGAKKSTGYITKRAELLLVLHASASVDNAAE